LFIVVVSSLFSILETLPPAHRGCRRAKQQLIVIDVLWLLSASWGLLKLVVIKP
jgi:hypothetical protein